MIQRLLDAIALFRRDRALQEQALAAFGITAVVILSITLLRMEVGYVFAAPQHPLPPQAERTLLPSAAAEAAILQEKYERLLQAYADMKTACMAGALRLTWIDPHTKRDRAAVCDVVTLGRIP